MQLREVKPQQVVQNVSNRSFYRLERIQDGRARITPLELFPNGLLIERPFPTLVDPHMDVNVVARWADPMYVESKGGKQRDTYERELVKKHQELEELALEEPSVPPAQAGSFRNKVKAVEARILVIQRGLANPTSETQKLAVGTEIHNHAANEIVQLPSGMLAKVVQTGNLVTIRTKGLVAQVPGEILRPGYSRYMATV